MLGGLLIVKGQRAIIAVQILGRSRTGEHDTQDYRRNNRFQLTATKHRLSFRYTGT